MPRDGLSTIAIPTRTDADPEGVASEDYDFDPEHYQDDALHGFALHRARKDVLGLTWLEYINEQGAQVPTAGEPDALAAELAAHLDVGGDEIEIARRVVDDLEGAVREAAYQGGREALRER